MATLTRSNSRVNPPVYKDYVNFLASYKNGKKEENFEADVKDFSLSNSDSGVSVKNFSLANSSNNTSTSSLSSDVTDFSKNSCTSYSNFLESSKSKKFSSVKPNLEEKQENGHSNNSKNFIIPKQKREQNGHSDNSRNFIISKQNFEEKPTKKSEIYIEIEPVKSVSQVSKMFENPQNRKSHPKSNKINSKINIFEKQISTERPKLATKPVVTRSASLSSPKIDLLSPKETKLQRVASPPPQPEIIPPPPKPLQETQPMKSEEIKTLPPPPPPLPTAAPISKAVKTNSNLPPPPPPLTNQPAKIQAHLIKGPQTRYSVNSSNGTVPSEIDRNDPLVKKLVYGTLRGLYGAYHDKANDMLATLPKNMVVRTNGVQDRIEQIAANGDLGKLNGRINPKLEQDPN